MKIAIASVGRDENALVSDISGRAPFYLIFEDKKLVKIISNPFRMGGGGAGFGVAKMLADEKVDLVIAGSFGPNMVSSLENSNIRIKEMIGVTVKQALDKL